VTGSLLTALPRHLPRCCQPGPPRRLCLPSGCHLDPQVSIPALTGVFACPQVAIPTLRLPSRPSGCHPDPHWCLCLPSGCHPDLQVSILTLTGVFACPQVSMPALTGVSDPIWKLCGPEGLARCLTGGLLSTNPTGISESQASIWQSQMTSTGPTVPLLFAIFLDFSVVCLMVR